jgi:hypothetical protein
MMWQEISSSHSKAILIIYSLVTDTGGTGTVTVEQGQRVRDSGGSIVFSIGFATALMIVFRQRYRYHSGTHHGGLVLPDGRLAEVKVAFDTLAEISRVARDEFGLSGAVQHGASTLPMEIFSRFPESETVEIHLALGFNNLIFDHPRLPDSVKQEIRSYVFTRHGAERKAGQTDAQFLYTTRKKAWAALKARFWDLPADVRDAIRHSLEGMFGEMFERLKVGGTRDLVARFARASALPVPLPQALAQELAGERSPFRLDTGRGSCG